MIKNALFRALETSPCMNNDIKERDAKYHIGMWMRPETWFNFRIDFTGSILYSLFNVVFAQFFAAMAIRHGASNLDVGLLSAAPAIGSLFSPIWASMIRERSPKPFVLWPNLAARLSLILVGLWLTPFMFVSIAFFVNFLAGIQAPAYPALLTRIYPTSLRGRLMGYVRVAQAVFLIPLAYVVGVWMDDSGDKWPLIIGALLGALSVIVFYAVREVEPVPKTSGETPLRGITARFIVPWKLVKSVPGLGIFLIGVSATGFGNLLAGPLFQIYQIHALNLNNAQIGITRVAYYTLLLVAYFIQGFVIDKLSPRHALVFGMLAYALAPLLYVLIGNYASVIVASACLGAGDATWDIGVMSYIFKLAPGREASVFGLHLLLFGLRGTVAPVLSTVATQVVPLSVVLTVASALCLAGMFMIWFRGGTKPSSMENSVSAPV